jgi:excisionase family DNA binding protein
MKKRLSVNETAARLNLSVRATWALIYRRQIPYRRNGRRIWIFEDELHEFLEKLPGVSVEEALRRVGDRG